MRHSDVNRNCFKFRSLVKQSLFAFQLSLQTVFWDGHHIALGPVQGSFCSFQNSKDLRPRPSKAAPLGPQLQLRVVVVPFVIVLITEAAESLWYRCQYAKYVRPRHRSNGWTWVILKTATRSEGGNAGTLILDVLWGTFGGCCVAVAAWNRAAPPTCG